MMQSLENLLGKLSMRKRTPQDIVGRLREEIEIAELDTSPEDAKKKAVENASKSISAIRLMLFGDGVAEPVQESIDAFAKMAGEDDLLLLLASHLKIMAFETRKDCVQVFNNLLKRTIDDNLTVLDYLSDRDNMELETNLMKGYEATAIALVSGSMLRECLRSEAITKRMLESPLFWKLFALVEASDFDVASDAYATFKEILTRHQAVVASFLEAEYDKFFECYNLLLRSGNYVSRRQSLKLLGELLMDRANFRVMTKYIASAENLKLIMNLLLDKGKHIQFEAFHVFKVFVANPNKSLEVSTILKKNKTKLEAYLNNFLTDRQDEQFQEEREAIVEEITEL